MQKIGEEHQDLRFVRVSVLDAPEGNRLFKVLVKGGQRDDEVAEHVCFSGATTTGPSCRPWWSSWL